MTKLAMRHLVLPSVCEVGLLGGIALLLCLTGKGDVDSVVTLLAMAASAVVCNVMLNRAEAVAFKSESRTARVLAVAALLVAGTAVFFGASYVCASKQDAIVGWAAVSLATRSFIYAGVFMLLTLQLQNAIDAVMHVEDCEDLLS